MKKNHSINPYTGMPSSNDTLEGYVISRTNSSSNKNNDSILKGYVDPSMLSHNTAKSHGSLSSHLNTHSGYDYQGSYEYGKSKVLSVGVPFVSNQSANIINSNMSSSDYVSSIKHVNSVQADKNYQEVAHKAINILNEAKQVTDTILRADCHVPEIVYMGDSICKKLGQHFLHEAEHNDCAYPETRDEWKAKGDRYLACNIYDIMKDNGILPTWGIPYLTPLPLEEDSEMIAQLRAQLELLRLGQEQRDNTILELNNTIEQQANDLIAKDNIIVEKDNALVEKDELILQLQTTNHDLTERLTISKENNEILKNENDDLKEVNLDLTNKLVINEGKVIPLQEKVLELKHFNEILETDKIELREDKKMLVDDKKMLQEEKKLLLKEKDSFLVDKKGWQDLISVRENELVELKHIHFDTEHCTIVGHCNNPDHEGI